MIAHCNAKENIITFHVKATSTRTIQHTSHFSTHSNYARRGIVNEHLCFFLSHFHEDFIQNTMRIIFSEFMFESVKGQIIISSTNNCASHFQFKFRGKAGNRFIIKFWKFQNVDYKNSQQATITPELCMPNIPFLFFVEHVETVLLFARNKIKYLNGMLITMWARIFLHRFRLNIPQISGTLCASKIVDKVIKCQNSKHKNRFCDIFHFHSAVWQEICGFKFICTRHYLQVSCRFSLPENGNKWEDKHSIEWFAPATRPCHRHLIHFWSQIQPQN